MVTRPATISCDLSSLRPTWMQQTANVMVIEEQQDTADTTCICGRNSYKMLVIMSEFCIVVPLAVTLEVQFTFTDTAAANNPAVAMMGR